MYNYEDITSIHLEVTTRCQARCPMCPRRVNGGPELDGLDLTEISYQMFTEWFPISFVQQLKNVYVWQLRRSYCCPRHTRNIQVST